LKFEKSVGLGLLEIFAYQRDFKNRVFSSGI